MDVKTKTNVTPEDLGGGEAGAYIADTAYFFGALTFRGGASFESHEDFHTALSDAVVSDTRFLAEIAKNEGAQLALIIEGDLRVAFPFDSGGFRLTRDGIDALNDSSGATFGMTNQPELSFCLCVRGSLHAPAFLLNRYSHANVIGDMSAPYIQIDGSDGEQLFCSGEVSASYYVQNQPQPRLDFTAPPSMLRFNELAREYQQDRDALLNAVEAGEDITGS